MFNKFDTTIAVAALTAWAMEAATLKDNREAVTSGREAFATVAIDAAASHGRGGLDDIKVAFDAMPKDERDRIKGGVTETLNLIKWVMAGNTIPAGKVNPAAACIADLKARPCALSTYAKAWREAKGKAGADASETERNETALLGLGIKVLGMADSAHASDAYAAKVKGLTDYHGRAIADILAAGALEAEALAVDAKAREAQEQREAFRAEVIAYLRSLDGLERGDLMAEVMEGETLAIAANG